MDFGIPKAKPSMDTNGKLYLIFVAKKISLYPVVLQKDGIKISLFWCSFLKKLIQFFNIMNFNELLKDLSHISMSKKLKKYISHLPFLNEPFDCIFYPFIHGWTYVLFLLAVVNSATGFYFLKYLF